MLLPDQGEWRFVWLTLNDPTGTSPSIPYKGTFWVSGVPVPYELESVDSESTVRELVTSLAEAVPVVEARVRALKVSNSTGSVQEAKRLLDAYKSLFDSLHEIHTKYVLQSAAASSSSSTSSMPDSLAERVKRMLASSIPVLRDIFDLFQELSREERLDKMKHALESQLVASDFKTRSNASGLARRAAKAGDGIEGTMCQELRELVAHLQKDSGLLDKERMVTTTTKEGLADMLRALITLLNNNALTGLTMQQLLMLAHLPGVPCKGPVGSFPDPSVYRISEVLLGNVYTMADLCMYKTRQDGQSPTLTPVHGSGEPVTVTHVVPLFTQPGLARLFWNTCPTFMNVVCSMGMRGLPVMVPHTYLYSLTALVLRLSEQHMHAPNDSVLADTLSLALRNLSALAGNLYAPMAKAIQTAASVSAARVTPMGAPRMLPFIGYVNWASKFLALQLAFRTSTISLLGLATVLREVYAHEVYMMVKPSFETEAKRVEALNHLLGLRWEQTGKVVPGPFESKSSYSSSSSTTATATASTTTTTTTTTTTNADDLTELASVMTIHPKAAAMTRLLQLIVYTTQLLNGSSTSLDTTMWSRLKTPSVAFLERALGLSVSLDLYDWALVVQAHIYHEKSLRCVEDKDDPAKSQSLVPDLNTEQAIRAMVETYRAKWIQEEYDRRVARVAQQEQEVMLEQWIDHFGKATMRDWCDTLKSGTFHYRGRTLSLANSQTPALQALFKHVLTLDLPAQMALDRDLLDKLYALYTGCETSTSSSSSSSSYSSASASASATSSEVKTSVEPVPVWNRGSALDKDVLVPFLDRLATLPKGKSAALDVWVAQMQTVKATHRYRPMATNRRGHSAEVPSYGHYGFDDLTSYIQHLNQSRKFNEAREYIRVHGEQGCCGFGFKRRAIGAKLRAERNGLVCLQARMQEAELRMAARKARLLQLIATAEAACSSSSSSSASTLTASASVATATTHSTS